MAHWTDIAAVTGNEVWGYQAEKRSKEAGQKYRSIGVYETEQEAREVAYKAWHTGDVNVRVRYVRVY